MKTVLSVKKEDENTQDKLSGFILKNRKVILGSVCGLIVVAAAVCTVIGIIDANVKKALSAVSAAEYVYTNSSDELSEDEIAARQAAALEAVSVWTSKKNVAGVRANMLSADISFAKNDFEAAKKFYADAAACDVKAYTAPINWFNAGVCAEKINANDEAVDFYTKASDSKEFLLASHALFSLARVYETKGDVAKAVELYQSVADKYSTTEWASLAQSRIIALGAQGKAE